MSLYKNIIQKRKQLDWAVENLGLQHSETQKISAEIDELINKYYKEEKTYAPNNSMYYYYNYSLQQLHNLFFQEKIFPNVDDWNKFAKVNSYMSSESLKYISGLNWNILRDRIHLKI